VRGSLPWWEHLEETKMNLSVTRDDIDAYRLRLDRPLLRWDRHVGACQECLSVGTHLCMDGEDLASEVRRARLALVRAEARILDRETRLLRKAVPSAPFAWLRIGRPGPRP
jgi:hypothetical protein